MQMWRTDGLHTIQRKLVYQALKSSYKFVDLTSLVLGNTTENP